MRERGIVPELEIFDFGMKSKISHYLIGRGVLHPPFVCNLRLGSLGTSAATAHNLWVWFATLVHPSAIVSPRATLSAVPSSARA